MFKRLFNTKNNFIAFARRGFTNNPNHSNLDNAIQKLNHSIILTTFATVLNTYSIYQIKYGK